MSTLPVNSVNPITSNMMWTQAELITDGLSFLNQRIQSLGRITTALNSYSKVMGFLVPFDGSRIKASINMEREKIQSCSDCALAILKNQKFSLADYNKIEKVANLALDELLFLDYANDTVLFLERKNIFIQYAAAAASFSLICGLASKILGVEITSGGFIEGGMLIGITSCIISSMGGGIYHTEVLERNCNKRISECAHLYNALKSN